MYGTILCMLLRAPSLCLAAGCEGDGGMAPGAAAGSGASARARGQHVVPVSGNPHSSRIKACLMTDPSGVEDRSFNASAWRGILSCYGESREKPRQKGKAYDLVMTAGFMWADPMSKAALRFPSRKCFILDVDWI